MAISVRLILSLYDLWLPGPVTDDEEEPAVVQVIWGQSGSLSVQLTHESEICFYQQVHQQTWNYPEQH